MKIKNIVKTSFCSSQTVSGIKGKHIIMPADYFARDSVQFKRYKEKLGNE